MKFTHLTNAPLSCAALLLSFGIVLPGAQAAQFGEVSVFAQVPVPNGFPEGIAVNATHVYVAGPATFGTSINGQPSRVFEFDATGQERHLDSGTGRQRIGAPEQSAAVAGDAL